MKYRTFAATLLATLAAGFAGSAGAASWPERPITLIVPFPAGGGTDTFARPLAQQLTTQLGQSVVIDNKGARAAPWAPAWPPRPGPTATPSSWAARTMRWRRRCTRA